MKALSVLVFTLTVTLSSLSFAGEGRSRWLINDMDALQARVDILQQAKHEILAEYFSVFNDDQAVGGFALLLDAARRGVKVKIIMDAVSSKVPKRVFDTMMENGKDVHGNQNIEIKLYNPITLNLLTATHRNHSKMLIVDGKILITGDRNIGKKYFGLDSKRNFNSIDILTDGAEAVKNAREDFLAVYDSAIVTDASYERNRATQLRVQNCNKASVKDRGACENRRGVLLRAYERNSTRIQRTLEDILKDTPDDIVKSHTKKDWLADVEPGSDIEFISHQPDKFVSEDSADLTDALIALLGTTKKDLNILSPYLIPTKNMFTVLEQLLKEKIRIRVVTNSLLSTDNVFAQAGYIAAKKRLIEMGVELYEYNGPSTTHAKALVIDHSVVFIGTYNLDPRSAFLNREVGLFIKNSPNNQIAEELTKQIEILRENSLNVGKDGIPQNIEEQKSRYKELSLWKKVTLKMIKPFVRFFESQL